MKIKKYEVFEMREAMKLIKEELGPEATILSTKKVMKNNSFGLFSRPMYEVTAAIDTDDRLSKRPKQASTLAGKEPEKQSPPMQEELKDLDKITELINALGLNKFESLMKDIGDIKRQIIEMKSTMKDNVIVDLSPNVRDFYNLMVKNGVDDIIAYKFLKKIEKRTEMGLTKNQIRNLITQLMSELIPVEKDYFSSIKQKVLALVGPTGVGKTTTIAKIAANLSLKLNKSVALITVDNFRIGAVEQLKTYAEIVDIPLRVASTPSELERIIHECRDYEYVFVDSMGRSQFDDDQIGDLLKFMEVSPAIKVALVQSMSSNHAEMMDTYDRYAKLMPEYLIFTKLDETRYFGPLINLPIKKKTPIMLLSKGQNVPDDMEVPDGKKIAGKILNEIPAMWSDK
jgi:flagellar biosynthesis protein FlhF